MKQHKILDSDIATVEALHDLPYNEKPSKTLFDRYRVLINKLYAMVEEQKKSEGTPSYTDLDRLECPEWIKDNLALSDAIKSYDTLEKIIEQLEGCEYKSDGGVLEKNVAFIALKHRAKKEAEAVTCKNTIAIQRNESSYPIEYKNVINAYTKGQLYCVMFENKEGKRVTHKFPLSSIFRVIEDYSDSKM